MFFNKYKFLKNQITIPKYSIENYNQAQNQIGGTTGGKDHVGTILLVVSRIA